jgi:ribosomal protein L31
MRKGIHPLLRRLQLVTTQGASTTVWSTLAARDGRILLQADHNTHPAWTGRKAAISNTGRVARFRQRFQPEAAAASAAAAAAAARAAKEAAADTLLPPPAAEGPAK